MSRFGVRPIPPAMMPKHVWHLTAVVVALATFSVFPSYGVHVVLQPHRNFSLECDMRWVPVCAECEEVEKTFANYCLYYTERAKDESCEFRHFDACAPQCRRRKCSRKKEPICARCGLEDLSFRNQCEYENYECLYGNPCEKKEHDYCKTRYGKRIRQKFFETSKIHKAMITRVDIFDKS